MVKGKTDKKRQLEGEKFITLSMNMLALLPNMCCTHTTPPPPPPAVSEKKVQTAEKGKKKKKGQALTAEKLIYLVLEFKRPIDRKGSAQNEIQDS